MREISLKKYLDELKNQGVEKEDYAFICPACGFIQSARDFLNTGNFKNFDDCQSQLGFSCIGRQLGAGSPDKKKGGPCNWTLGGLFRIHELIIITPDKKEHMRFEVATPEQAKKHRDELLKGK